MSDETTKKYIEKYCIYCKKTEKEIRAENRRYGGRVPCRYRGTPKGFHQFVGGYWK